MFGYIVKVCLLWSHVYMTCSAFNVEDRIPIIKQGPKQSLFGLAVEQHYTTENPSSLNDITFLVGAPKAAAASDENLNLQNPGALFQCSISSQRQCQRVKVNLGRQSFEVNNSNSWLGVAVKSQKPGGLVAVCAHRFTIRGGSANKVVWEAGVGRCYLLDRNLNEVDFPGIIQPCVGKVGSEGTYSEESYGYCQAGASCVFADNIGEEIGIGMPGTELWRGEIYTYELSTSEFFPDFIFSNAGINKQQVDHYSYVGYSIAAGFHDLLKKSGEPLFAAGAPRGGNVGQVVVFQKITTKNEIKHNVTAILHGEVVGSAFGHAVEIVDVTGDSKSDLIIGAPHYYDRVNKTGGAIYVYVNKGLGKHKLGPAADVVVYGEPDSAFGSSITTLGDINMDGFNDIAIGAPGADQGIGRVYIFHGTRSGVIVEPAQIISGQRLYLTDSFSVRGFGYALSGGLDMDLNGYPDLIVGSLSDAAFLYRCRPIVNVTGSISASNDKININLNAQYNPNIVTIDVSKPPKKFVSFNTTICLSYTALPLTFDEPVDITYTVKLDVNNLDNEFMSRVSFSPLSKIAIKSGTLKLHSQTKNIRTCETFSVYLDNEMQDKLSPFVLSLSYDVVNKTITDNTDLTSLNQYPIFNKNLENIVFAQVGISKNCGEDEICESDLRMNVQYMVWLNGKSNFEPLPVENGTPVLYAGTEKKIGIKANISNAGEDAHQAKLNIVFPDSLTYDGVNGLSSQNCKPSVQNNTLIVCELGNPFRKGNQVSLLIRFLYDESLYDVNQFSVSMGLETSSVQPQLFNHSYAVAVLVQAKLTIDGYAAADQIPFGGKIVGESAVRAPQDVGLYVNYEYEIENSGDLHTGPVVATINWPYAISNGKWLFYLLEYQVTGKSFQNDAVCNVLPDQLDPLNIKEKQVEFQSNSRLKREVAQSVTEEELPHQSASVLDSNNPNVELLCPDTARCLKITCSLGIMPRQTKLFLNITGVVWNATLLEEFNGTARVRVFSTAGVFVNRTNILYASSSVLNDTIITTLLSEVITAEEYRVEWWIVVVAVLAGVLLLIFIVLIMYKCGFFKRRRNNSDYHKARQYKQASRKADEYSDQLVY